MMGFFYIPCAVCKKTFGWQSSNPQICSECGPVVTIPWVHPGNTRGWECPRCNKVYSPMTSECTPCNSPVASITVTNLPKEHWINVSGVDLSGKVGGKIDG